MTFRSSAVIYGIILFTNLVINGFEQGFQRVINRNSHKMLISTKSVNKLAEKLDSSPEIFCSGLFLSARWFVVSQLDHDGMQLIVLPDKESAEYCAADLYNLIEGDKVFFLPDSGKNLEKSNYKSTLGVQRTSAIGKMLDYKEGQLIIVSYPSALEEGIPEAGKIKDSLLKLSVGDEISHEDIIKSLFDSGFERVDFVGEPGQFAIIMKIPEKMPLSCGIVRNEKN